MIRTSQRAKKILRAQKMLGLVELRGIANLETPASQALMDKATQLARSARCSAIELFTGKKPGRHQA